MNLPVMAPGLDRDHRLEWSRRIDAGPYSHIAAGERINFPKPEIVVALSAAAAVTSRVGILLNVLVLPMHSAVVAAKQLATLDVLAAGRLTVGVGAGARDDDYAAAGVSRSKRPLADLAEQVAVMRRVWRGEIVVPGAARPVEPFPVQPGGPKILAGSLSDTSVRLAAGWADGICGFSFGPDIPAVARSFETARVAWKDAGRETPPRLVTNCWFALGPAARAQLDTYLLRYLRFLGPGVAEQLAPTVTTTSAGALADVVRRLEDCGADELSLVPTTTDPDEIDRVTEALA
jgi:alkanesulfonate monooxygenase SsuD/methylene tetrahydromethanopterin reductase-like flavin-dependent oxidoreductase (luciferase family)